MQRVSVVGNTGSGKSQLAERVAAALDVPYVELDAIHHLPNWRPMDPGEFLATVTEIAATDAWVIDGSYRTVVSDGPVWQRADTVVWLDLPLRKVMRQVIARSLRRLIRREVLWNGNRERVRNVLSSDPHRSIIRWAWTQHEKYQERFTAAVASPAFPHIDFVRLTSHSQADAWLADLAAAMEP